MFFFLVQRKHISSVSSEPKMQPIRYPIILLLYFYSRLGCRTNRVTKSGERERENDDHVRNYVTALPFLMIFTATYIRWGRYLAEYIRALRRLSTNDKSQVELPDKNEFSVSSKTSPRSVVPRSSLCRQLRGNSRGKSVFLKKKQIRQKQPWVISDKKNCEQIFYLPVPNNTIVQLIGV